MAAAIEHRAFSLAPDEWAHVDFQPRAGRARARPGSYDEALGRFGQAVARQPGGWFSWFGSGLAASELGERADARHDFEVAKSLNSSQQVIKDALSRVDGPTPMTTQQGLDGLVLAH
jgi:Flp pilus assembly protein TadD